MVKTQWSCSYCKRRKLVKERNCGNKFPDTQFTTRLGPYGIITQCPISSIDKEAYNLYTIVKECNQVGMGSSMQLPSLFYSEANIYFECRDIVFSVIGEFDELREQQKKRKEGKK